MPADLTKPFSESCCDGGEGSTSYESARPCGCDYGLKPKPHFCQRHQEEASKESMPKSNDWIKKEGVNPIERHLQEVVKPTWNYAKRLETHKDHVLNAVMGLAGEAAEVLDEHKKLFFHKEKDRRQAIKFELGDVCYYLAKTLDLYNLTLEEVLEANKEKLFERHGI